MITNPTIGMRIKVISTAKGREFLGKHGQIIYIDTIHESIEVRLDELVNDYYGWSFRPEWLEAETLTPEEQDQADRLAHAMKYL